MDAREALRFWEREGLLSHALAERLEQSLAGEPDVDRSSPLIRVLVFIGAVLIGGGLLLFIGSQWDEQSPLRRMLLLVGVYALIVAAAALAGSRRLDTTARGLWFLSSIAVGVNIFLIGQIYNLPLNYWQGTLLWMIAALAMGWAVPSSAQGWLAVVLGVLTLGWLSVPRAEFFDQGAFLWDPSGIRPLVALIGLALAAASLLVTPTDFAFLRRPARAVGVLLVAVPLTISTFHPDAFALVFQMDARTFHAVVMVAAAAVIGAAWIRTSSPLLARALPVLAVLLALVLPQSDPDRSIAWGVVDTETVSWLHEHFAESELLFGLYTALVFALALGCVALGSQLRIPALVNTGMVVIAVLATAVYIGRLAGTLPTSIAVLLGGLVLVGFAVFLERKRRDILAEAAP